MAESGITHQTIAGSCLEYGKVEGAMVEDQPPQPVTYYGLAKVTLYNMLRLLSDSGTPIALNWLRYFYAYGAGQRQQALLPQLYAAIERGDHVFNMSPGDQRRDFIHIDALAHNTVLAAEQAKGLGILNIGNGLPVRVLELVDAARKEKGSDITLNIGFYGYPAYEPYSFHADVKKLSTLKNARFNEKFIL